MGRAPGLGITVRRITALETIPLRSEVLRPGLPLSEAMFAGDELASTTHWGAFGADGKLCAVASLFFAPMPGAAGIPPSWQLRGMASAPAVRGQGYGEAVLGAIVEWVRADDSGGLWCNARVSAVEFYKRHGFEKVGAEFEIAGVGPHFRMRLR